MGRRAGEQDALSRWFAMQRRDWLKKWRWAVLLIVLIFFLRVAWGVASFAFEAWMMDVGWQQAKTSPNYSTWLYLSRDLRGILRYEAWFWWPVGVWLASTLVVAQRPRGEIVLAFSGPEIYRRLLAQSRRTFWPILGILILTVPVMNLVNPAWFIGPLSDYVLVNAFEPAILLCSIVLVTELQLALLLRIPFSVVRFRLYALPVLVTLINLEMMDPGGLIPFSNMSPGVYTQLQLHVTDLYVAVGHISCLLVGIAIGCYWLANLLRLNRIREWRIYFAAVAAGQLLPAVSYFWQELLVSRVVIPVSAFLRGINIGNPLLGWSDPRIQALNPYGQDWDSWEQYANNWMAIDKFDELWNYAGHDGVVLAPLVYAPVWGAWLWLLIYFGLSIWVIARGNNRAPAGFTGSWDAM